MRSLGFRCWKDRFAFVVLRGKQQSARLVAQEVRRAPTGAGRAEFLSWIRKSVREIIAKYDPDEVRYKTAEGSARNKDLARAQVEGVLQEAAYSRNRIVTSKVKSQLRKDICAFTGQAGYVQRALPQHGLTTLDVTDYREAALAALSGLPPA